MFGFMTKKKKKIIDEQDELQRGIEFKRNLEQAMRRNEATEKRAQEEKEKEQRDYVEKIKNEKKDFVLFVEAYSEIKNLQEQIAVAISVGFTIVKMTMDDGQHCVAMQRIPKTKPKGEK